MSLITNPATNANGLKDAVSKGIQNATAASAINPSKNTELLGKILSNPSSKLDWADRKIILNSIKQLNNGNTASRILKAVGKAVGHVVTKIEARRVLETKLNAKTAQQAIKSNENVQTAAIKAGLWNNGINYVSDTNNDSLVAPGTDGYIQSGTTGSYLGG